MKKLFTLVSIILFAIVLTACGNDKSGNSYDSKTVTIKIHMNSRIRIIHIIVVKRKLILLRCLIIPIV